MSDDKLLETLGKAAREQDRDDPLDETWDAFSRGELDEARIEALVALEAEGRVPEGSVEAFRPLGDDFRRSVAAQAAEALNAPASAPQGTETGSGGAGGTIPFPTARAERRQHRNLTPIAMAASVMLAVGIGFFALPGGDVAPIPGYTVLLQGGADSRSGPSDASIARFRSGDRFELRLTPETAVDGPVAARVYIGASGGLEPLATPAPVVAPSGALRIVGAAGVDVALPAGESQLYVVLGREDALPDERELARVLADNDKAAGRGWSAWRIGVFAEP